MPGGNMSITVSPNKARLDEERRHHEAMMAAGAKFNHTWENLPAEKRAHVAQQIGQRNGQADPAGLAKKLDWENFSPEQDRDENDGLLNILDKALSQHGSAYGGSKHSFHTVVGQDTTLAFTPFIQRSNHNSRIGQVEVISEGEE